VSFARIRKRLSNLSWLPRRSSWSLLLGSRGERAAARYLRRHGHRILARNYRCSSGEVDLISAWRDFIVFVEVKTRTSAEAQDPQEAVRSVQWGRIERAARHFLVRQSTEDHPCRFDFIAIVWPRRGSPTVEHYEDAYQPRRL
jgi:putative endonuclease